MNEFKKIFDYMGVSKKQFAATFRMPKDKVDDWLSGKEVCPDYVIQLLCFCAPIAHDLRRIEFKATTKKGGKGKYKDYCILYNRQVISYEEIMRRIQNDTWRKGDDYIITTTIAGAKTLGSEDFFS